MFLHDTKYEKKLGFGVKYYTCIIHIQTYTLPYIQYRSKVWDPQDFINVLKDVSYAHQGCI